MLRHAQAPRSAMLGAAPATVGAAPGGEAWLERRGAAVPTAAPRRGGGAAEAWRGMAGRGEVRWGAALYLTPPAHACAACSAIRARAPREGCLL